MGVRYYTASRSLRDGRGHTIPKGARYVRKVVYYLSVSGGGRDRWIKLCAKCAIAEMPLSPTLAHWLAGE